MKQTAGPSVAPTASYFNEIAEKYASWYDDRSPGGYALRVRQQLVLGLLDRPGGRILDVGCGPGILAGKLLEMGHQVRGVDGSAGMIELCRSRLGESHAASFAVGDAADLPFPDQYFDTVICTGVIDFVPDHQAVIRQMVRVAKPGGDLLMSFPNLLSPNTAWKKFVFYPVVELLRPLCYGLAGRPRPRSLPLSRNRLYTTRGASRILARHGAEVTALVYFYFNPFLSPLNELSPHRALRAAMRLERLSSGPLKWMGGGFILKARKRREIK